MYVVCVLDYVRDLHNYCVISVKPGMNKLTQWNLFEDCVVYDMNIAGFCRQIRKTVND